MNNSMHWKLHTKSIKNINPTNVIKETVIRLVHYNKTNLMFTVDIKVLESEEQIANKKKEIRSDILCE